MPKYYISLLVYSSSVVVRHEIHVWIQEIMIHELFTNFLTSRNQASNSTNQKAGRTNL